MQHWSHRANEDNRNAALIRVFLAALCHSLCVRKHAVSADRTNILLQPGRVGAVVNLPIWRRQMWFQRAPRMLVFISKAA